MTTNRCTRCQEKLNPSRVEWLELDILTGLYFREGVINPARSQGFFPFGSACSKRQLRDSVAKEITVAHHI